MKRIAVIGAGPSGLMSIVSLYEENKDIEVSLFEASDEIGKRIKVSGNGRCNFFHVPLDYNAYSNEVVAEKYMSLFMSKYNDIFKKLGIVYYSDEEGRCYPLSNSSKTIINIFEQFLKRNNVKIYLNTYVEEIKNVNNKVNIKFHDVIEEYDDVVLSVGGFSYLYNKDKKEDFFKKNNISLSKLSPSLTPIKTKGFHIKNLEGKRFKVNLSLTYKNIVLFKEYGEILIKKDGISGIVTFNLSSYLSRLHLSNYQDYIIHIDFAPSLNTNELQEIIFNNSFSLEENLSHLFIKELVQELLLKKENILNSIKDFRLNIVDLYPFSASQVTSGGINLNQINDDFSLKGKENIYPCGEILDIDGICGGYNIAFCFASGYHVAKKILKKY